MKLTTTETKQYAHLVVKLSTGATVSLAEYTKFKALVSKMKKPEPCKKKCAAPCAKKLTIIGIPC